MFGFKRRKAERIEEQNQQAALLDKKAAELAENKARADYVNKRIEYIDTLLFRARSNIEGWQSEHGFHNAVLVIPIPTENKESPMRMVLNYDKSRSSFSLEVFVDHPEQKDFRLAYVSVRKYNRLADELNESTEPAKVDLLNRCFGVIQQMVDKKLEEAQRAEKVAYEKAKDLEDRIWSQLAFKEPTNEVVQAVVSA